MTGTQIEMIAVGNGTAGRETESFIRTGQLPVDCAVVMVSENGASVYSASEDFRDVFADDDVTARGAVSIGETADGPPSKNLSKSNRNVSGRAIPGTTLIKNCSKKDLTRWSGELVRIKVGVELNTSSKHYHSYVSGLGPKRAQSIVDYRDEHGGSLGPGQNFKKVPGLGKKAFEQAAGFLRIRDGANPLDASAVHPESYCIVEQMARDLNCSVRELMQDESVC